MIIGVPKETKDQERRVGMIPAGVAALVGDGHRVLVGRDAGVGSGHTNDAYVASGAELVDNPGALFVQADLLVKVKEPQPPEFSLPRPGLIIFSFLSLGANPATAEALCENGVTAIGYETVQLPDGSLPLLKLMSAVTGRLAVEVGAHYLSSPQGGSGTLLSGVPGAPSAHVVVLGAGTAGGNAAEVALGMGARVTVISRGEERLQQLKSRLPSVETATSTHGSIANAAKTADVLIGVIRVPSGASPKLVTREMVRSMRPGSVIVDACIDQGGCVETSRHTTHSDPVYVEEGVTHYCVPNMPGAVPRTATEALCGATFPYIQRITKLGVTQALRQDPALALGLNTAGGHMVNQAVAQALGRPWVTAEEALAELIERQQPA
jgi:alanine dehydrogenase